MGGAGGKKRACDDRDCDFPEQSGKGAGCGTFFLGIFQHCHFVTLTRIAHLFGGAIPPQRQ
jgi:hypothetical protein